MTLAIALVWLLVSIAGGATASIAGFGIGSLLTPVLATRIPVADAILVVSIPHAAASVLRCWRLRGAIRRDLMKTFGVASAAGGLAGAFALISLQSIAGLILGFLLVATGIFGMTAWNRRAHPGNTASLALGALSGVFGGMAGNQGGMRAAALMAYQLTPAQFVATSTAVGVLVDAARLPIYIAKGSGALSSYVAAIGIATLGVLIGTLAGEKILMTFSRERFHQVVSVLIVLLGVWLLVSELR